jgi:hypothetical protein
MSLCPQESTTGPSTVELHRRALNLERAAADLLRALIEAVRLQGPSKLELSSDDVNDLEAFFQFHGGIECSGVYYWTGVQSSLIPR